MDVSEFFKEMGRKGGKIGGKRRVDATTPEQRSEWAKKAAAASAKVRAKKARAKKAEAKAAAKAAAKKPKGKE